MSYVRPGATQSDGYALVDHIAATLSGSRALAARSRAARGSVRRRWPQSSRSAARRCARRCASSRRTASSSWSHTEARARRLQADRAGDPRGVRGSRGARGLRGGARRRANPGATARARLHEAAVLFRRSIDELHEHRRGGGDGVPARSRTGRTNDVFHQAVLDAAGNDRLRRTLADLHRTIPRDLTSIVLGENARLLEENVEQHDAILAAIERLDRTGRVRRWSRTCGRRVRWSLSDSSSARSPVSAYPRRGKIRQVVVPCASSFPPASVTFPSAVTTREPLWITIPSQRIRPVSDLIGRTKFVFTSSVV